MYTSTHHGQHSPTCYGCKLNSLTFDRGRAKTHQHRGDPWSGNPVVERINELKAAGAKIATAELENPNKEAILRGNV